MPAQPNALCVNCGNQVFASAFSFAAKCAACGETLGRRMLNSNIRSFSAEPPGWKSWAAGGLVIAALIYLGNSSESTSRNNYVPEYTQEAPSYPQAVPPPAAQTQPEAEEATPVPIGTGEIRFSGNAERLAPLEIKTQVGTNYFVKLINGKSGATELVLYVAGGERLEVLMPIGVYEMKYAAGDVWYGEQLLFGIRTSYARADAPFDFAESTNGYSGYTVELVPQIGGNLPINQISASEF